MIENIPVYIPLVFGLITFATFIMFYMAIKKSSLSRKAPVVGLALIIWLIFHMIMSLNHYYLDTIGEIPPKFPLFSFLPFVILLIILFNTKNGKAFIDSLPLGLLTIISIIRIPVEIVLYWLFVHQVIPELLTFEGINFDILAGISAPIIAFYGFVKFTLSRKIILVWNIICLALLVNIVMLALFSIPTVLQQNSFDQPNTSMLYFPFVWLPSFVVPVVFFTHFVSIRQLMIKKTIPS